MLSFSRTPSTSSSSSSFTRTPSSQRRPKKRPKFSPFDIEGKVLNSKLLTRLAKGDRFKETFTPSPLIASKCDEEYLDELYRYTDSDGRTRFSLEKFQKLGKIIKDEQDKWRLDNSNSSEPQSDVYKITKRYIRQLAMAVDHLKGEIIYPDMYEDDVEGSHQTTSSLSLYDDVFADFEPNSKENSIKVPELFFQYLSRTNGCRDSEVKVVEVAESLNQTICGNSFLGRIFSLDESTIRGYVKQTSSGNINYRVDPIFCVEDKIKIAEELKHINRLCVQNNVCQCATSCRQIAKDLIKRDYSGVAFVDRWYDDEIIKRCNFLFQAPRLHTTARQNQENDIRNTASQCMILEAMNIKGKQISRSDKKVYGKYPDRFLSNQDETQVVLSTHTAKETKVAIDRDMKREMSKNNESVKSVSSNGGSLPSFLRVKTVVVTTMSGALTDVVFIIKCKMPDINPAPPQFSAADSVILKRLISQCEAQQSRMNTTSSEEGEDEEVEGEDENYLDEVRTSRNTNTASASTNTADAGTTVETEQNEEDLDEIDGAPLNVIDISEIDNARFIANDDPTLTAGEINKIKKSREKLEQQKQLFEKVRIIPIHYPNRREGCQFSLLLAPNGIMHQLLMEIVYMFDVKKVTLDENGNEEVTIVQNSIMASLKKAANAVGYIDIDDSEETTNADEFTTQEEEEHFKKLHAIDGCDAQIDMFQHYIEDDGYCNKYPDFRIAKLPAKCSGILQPNDLMEGFKLVKNPLKINKKIIYSNPLHKSVILRIRNLLNKYTLDMRNDTKNLLLKFLKQAGSSFTRAFNEHNIITGYDRGGYKEYSREKVLKLCKNRNLDFEAISAIVKEHEETFLDIVKTTGVLPDKLMQECGIPGLNKLAHNKDEINDLIFMYENEDSNENGVKNLPLIPEMYDPKDLEYIQRLPENTYTKNLCIYILRKKSIEVNENDGDNIESTVNNLQLITVDPLRINRQRAMLFLPKSEDNNNVSSIAFHLSRINELRKQEKEQRKKDNDQAKELIERRKRNKQISREIAKKEYSRLYQCQFCESVYDILPEEENIIPAEDENTDDHCIAEILKSEGYMERQEQVHIERHTFYGYLENWQYKPRLLCARCVSVQLHYHDGSDLLPHNITALIDMKKDNNKEVSRSGYKHWRDFIEIRNAKMIENSNQNQNNANNNNNNPTNDEQKEEVQP